MLHLIAVSEEDKTNVLTFSKNIILNILETKLFVCFFILETPSTELVSKVKKLYDNQIVEVRFLVPIISGLDKKYILNVLPQLIKLNPNVVKEVCDKNKLYQKVY